MDDSITTGWWSPTGRASTGVPALLALSPPSDPRPSAFIRGQLLAAGPRDMTPMMIWLGVLLLVVVAGGLGIMWYRRSLLAGDSPDAAEQGLMAGLRAMRDKGEISPEEFDAMRKSMVRKAAARHQADRTEPKPRPARTDRSGNLPGDMEPDKSK